jgi:hypothetical protein
MSGARAHNTALRAVVPPPCRPLNAGSFRFHARTTNRAAEAAHADEVAAAVVLQSAWRGRLQREHLATLGQVLVVVVFGWELNALWPKK